MLPAGDRPHLFYQLLVYRRRKGEAKGFAWSDYRDPIIATHHNLSAPLVWCWDNLNVHLAPELADFAAENTAWLRVFRLPAYAPELNPAEAHVRRHVHQQVHVTIGPVLPPPCSSAGVSRISSKQTGMNQSWSATSQRG